MAFIENIEMFLADFGVSCTIAGSAQTGIFDKAYAEQFGIVAGNSPMILIKDSALGAGVEGSAVVVNATTYSISAIEPDGTGMTLLRLEE